MAPPVLIVGAGPSGLILALSLLRNDVPVRIIEKKLEYSIGQKGAGIQPRTLEMFKFLGILPEMLKEATRLPKMEHWSSPQGKEPISVGDFGLNVEDTPAKPYHNMVAIGQDVQEGILRSVIEKGYGVHVELGSELRSFEQHEDHVTTSIAKVGKGGDGDAVVEEVEVSYLVGCDGARSVVRKQLGLIFVGDTPSIPASLLGDIHIVKGLDNSCMRMWGQMTGKAVLLRPYTIEKPDNRFFFIIGGPGIDAEKLLASREEFISTFYEITGRTDIEFGEMISQAVYRPNTRMVNKFGEGRVFVAGDSAHVHSPSGAQGLNSSFADSINLAWKIALVHKNLSPPTILETYSKERLPVIATMLNKTTELFKKSLVNGGVPRGLDRGYEFRQLGVNYRGSSLVLDERSEAEAGNKLGDGELIDYYRAGEDGSVRAGDRAPDAPELLSLDPSVTTESSSGQATIMTRFFDIFKPQKHTVLVFCGSGHDDVQDLIQDLSGYPAGTVQTVLIHPQDAKHGSGPEKSLKVDYALVDQGGYAYKHYLVDEAKGGVVIVRPDGWIGGLVNDVAGVKRYFGKIFV
ncbi:hypothetical protein D9758_014255 [Tetrapyrgos nigripes]|uniref:FAD-binding domain-containing protein n=1 Tax=Tetrapyrgos nigripes TaxID=182062 RepID=A0A8H5FIQ1_9AGAR|nr:hypothetical protein D9758_014255 [Tetrapyrgos nigripes]